MKYSGLFIFLILIPFNQSCDDNATDPCADYIDHVYIYPPYHCKDSIDCIDSFNKDIALRKIQDSYLRCSSTDSLIQTCLTYPLFMLIWTYTSLQLGFDNVKVYCNGFDELYSRGDLNTKLIEAYRVMKPENVTQVSDTIEIAREMEKFIFIEITIAQFNFIQKLTKNQTTLLLDNSIEKYDEKSILFLYYGITGNLAGLIIMARIMYTNDYKPFVNGISQIDNLDYFIQTGYYQVPNYQQIFDFIVLNARNYLNNLK